MKKLYLDGGLFIGTEEEFLAVEKFYKKEWEPYRLYHRVDGPAVIYSDGTEYWFQNGNLHRTDGPAILFPGRPKEWHLFGECFTNWFPMNYLFSYE